MNEIDKKYNWTDWRPFPNPNKNEFIYAPFGAGVYQLRNKVTGEYVLFGKGENLAYRMSSLLPPPYGQGTRANMEKRKYVWRKIDDIEYRTIACDGEKAQEIEDELKKLNIHIFNN